MNEQHLYHQEALNNWDYSKDDWAKTNDTQFADMSDFNDIISVSSILPDDTFHLVGDEILQQPEKEKNIS